MNYYNLNNPNEKVDLKTALFKSISSDSGLYMPESIPLLKKSFLDNLAQFNLQEIALELSRPFLIEDISEADLGKLISEALSFDIPLKQLYSNLHVLELFHGPTLAFKDVGARFMAGLFETFLAKESKELIILVATSGDTGSAVASAFYNKKGIKVVILYPSAKVSELQEKQLTTMGGNITALECDGNFDDCQRLVKTAFADLELNKKFNLTSANSINFGRLLPQSFYYFYALAQLGKINRDVIVSVPSGNFGNLTAGLMAKKMGLAISKFIAATNANCSVPNYLKTGKFITSETIYTLSNAMDVGNPSNFPRLLELYEKYYPAIIKDITGYSFSDEQTRSAMLDLYNTYSYLADPHGAIAYAGLKQFGLNKENIHIFLETAHPVKFPNDIKIPIPEKIKGIMSLEKKAIKISKDYEIFKEFLIKI
jgi:threonine synthase